MRLIGRAASFSTSAFLRVATAIVSLIALRVTHELLSAEDFTRYNVVLMIIAVSGALASPINRQFWANNNESSYVRSVFATIIVSALTILAAFAVLPGDSLSDGAPLLAGLAVLAYSIARDFERYTYGRTMFAKSFAMGLTIPFAFAIMELLAVAVLAMLSLPVLPLRIVLPAAFFALTVILLQSHWSVNAALATSLRTLPDLPSFTKQVYLSPTAAMTLTFYVILTMSTMAERMVVGAFGTGEANFASDYLLMASYAIAWQTLLSAAVDLARKHVYHANAWLPAAGKATVQLVAGIAALSLGLILALPVLKLIRLMPDAVELLDWATLITKATSIVCVQIAFIDSTQQGHLVGAIAFTTAIGLFALWPASAIVMNTERLPASFTTISMAIVLSVISLTLAYRRRSSK